MYASIRGVIVATHTSDHALAILSRLLLCDLMHKKYLDIASAGGYIYGIANRDELESMKGIQMTATITTAELATALDIDPRTLRKFLRADAKSNETETPGKGKRYALPSDKRSINAMQKKFATWTAAQKVRNTDTPDASDDEEVEDITAE